MSEGNRDKSKAIAIVGMACIFPKAPDLETFWNNILNKVDAIRKPLPEWEDWRYLDSKRINSSNGGYLKDLYRFDPQEFSIMPNSVDGGEPDHFLALKVARDALLDAGYPSGVHDHSNTGIILGHSTYLHRGQGNLIQHHIVMDQTIDLLETIFPGLDQAQATEIRKIIQSKLPQYSADIVPGLVPNVMTGLIANRLNLNGPNYLVDAACSSSLLAVNAAMDELRNGRSRMMLTGGVNASLPAEVSTIFTDLGALSKKGHIQPFDSDADGTLLGEGLGVIVLKMLHDAMEDGDRIYAVIHGIGQSSDGKGQGLLAPSMKGQALALERAYQTTGIDPSTVGLLEAHGTGIPLGDKTEIAALKKIFGDRKGVLGNVAIGSIKSMISHCIPAAGIAGLIKTALALHHKILPPTLCSRVNPDLGIDETPFYVNTTPRPWFLNPGVPRRSGINSFGFGGINTHAILEEAPAEAEKPLDMNSRPAELCVFSASSRSGLVQKLDSTADIIKKSSEIKLGEFASFLLNQDLKETHRLGIVAKSKADLEKKIGQSIKRIKKNADDAWVMRSGIVFSSTPLEGKIAFMFPGEGSQYVNMLSDLALYFDEVREWFNFWYSLYDDTSEEKRTDIVFPQSLLPEEQKTALGDRIHQMDVGSEAAFIGGQAMYSLLQRLGISANVMVGHSTGESSALAASGAINYDDKQQLSAFIRELNNVYKQALEAGNIPTGALLSVGALSRENVEKLCLEVDEEVVVAMENCPNQLILFGAKASIDEVQKKLSKNGGICMLLPFDRGYHTSKFSAVSDAFLAYYEQIQLTTPKAPLYSCATGTLFPLDVNGVRETAAIQWSREVKFAQTISAMHRDGIRYFIEVGPSGNLSAFVNDILSGKDFIALPTDLRKKNSLEQLLFVLANLYANNQEVTLESLFSSRFINQHRQKKLDQSSRQEMFLHNTMPIIHLDSQEGEQIRRLLAVSEKHVDMQYPEEIPETLSTEVLPTAEQTTARSQFVLQEEDSQVMEKYFHLMQDFLKKQNAVVEHLTHEQSGIVTEHISAPLIDTINELSSYQCSAECHFNLYETNFLKDHVLSGVVSAVDPDLLGLSCVPLMVSLEIMAEACALIAGSYKVTVIENVKANGWIALDEYFAKLTVNANILPNETSRYRGSILYNGKEIVSAEFSFEEQWILNGLQPLKQKEIFRWQDQELYTIGMFHGPLFQSIQGIEGWDSTGIDARLSRGKIEGFIIDNELPALTLNPVLLDATGQLAAYWIAQQVGTGFNCFPSTIERIELYRTCPHNMDGLSLKARQQPVATSHRNGAKDNIQWQFECLDSDGKALFRIHNLANVYFEVPNNFYLFRRDPLNGRLGSPCSFAEESGVVLWQLPHMTEKFCSQSEGIFIRILANALLSFDELKLWHQISLKNVRYKRQWLFGRACIKEATQWWVYHQTGKMLYPADIEVFHDNLGAPYVDGWWRDSLIEAPVVSLSHDRKMSIAAVAPGYHAIGVDVEQIGRISHPAAVAHSLSRNEQDLLTGLDEGSVKELLLSLLCSKEAAAKCLGLGLQGRPESFEVFMADKGKEECTVIYENTVLNVKLYRSHDTILALAQL